MRRVTLGQHSICSLWAPRLCTFGRLAGQETARDPRLDRIPRASKRARDAGQEARDAGQMHSNNLELAPLTTTYNKKSGTTSISTKAALTTTYNKISK